MTGSKILWINPVGTDLYDAPIAAALALEAGPGTTVDVASFPGPGPQHLEHNAFEMMVAPQLMGTIRWGEEAGYDAAIIGCFYDPGLRGAREVAQRMAVTAPAEATLHIANTLGERPSILVGRRKWIPEMHENVTKYGFASRLASFRVLGMGVDEFQKDVAHTEERIMEEARLAVEQDGADVIILGCTIEFGFYKQVQEEIGVPVVDAIVAPLRYAEFLADLRDRHGWAHSKALGYEGPSGDSWDWIPAMEPNLTRRSRFLTVRRPECAAQRFGTAPDTWHPLGSGNWLARSTPGQRVAQGRELQPSERRGQPEQQRDRS